MPSEAHPDLGPEFCAVALRGERSPRPEPRHGSEPVTRAKNIASAGDRSCMRFRPRSRGGQRNVPAKEKPRLGGQGGAELPLEQRVENAPPLVLVDKAFLTARRSHR